jgi:hypothetical protein
LWPGSALGYPQSGLFFWRAPDAAANRGADTLCLSIGLLSVDLSQIFFTLPNMNIDNMEYNTTRNHLVMREYGRHIQKMIEYLLSLEDKEKRQRNAYAVIELMGFLNPHLKNVEDFRHKLWDHLFLISDFKLEVASPYPIPTRETLKARPKPLKYPKRYPKFSHMGKNLEIVINKALAEENPDKRNGFANAVAYYMKLAYNNWHKETVHDDAIQARALPAHRRAAGIHQYPVCQELPAQRRPRARKRRIWRLSQ